MKFTTVFAVIATLTTAVSAIFSGASDFSTNAKRFKAGLTPLRPRSLGHGTPVYAAKRGHPSGIHNSCNGGHIHCCDSVTTATPENRKLLEKLLDIAVAPDVAVGLTCSPLSAIGVSHRKCTRQTVCCEGNKFSGPVVIGCSPINVNLV